MFTAEFVQELREHPLQRVLLLILLSPLYLFASLFRSRAPSKTPLHRYAEPKVVEDRRLQAEHELHGAPESLPTNRLRTLTMTDKSSPIKNNTCPSCAQADDMVTTVPQCNSPLFGRFSAELRIQVYSHALAHSTIPLHLARAHKKLTHIRCFGSDEDVKP